MDIEQFTRTRRFLFHGAFEDNLSSILQDGLRTPESVLAAAGFGREDIEATLSEPRDRNVTVQLSDGRRIVMRDQKPLLIEHLHACYPEIDTRAYIRNLGRRIYFWCRPEDATVTKAREYRAVRQFTLVFDARKLLAEHWERIELCRINSGAVHKRSIGAIENRDPKKMFEPFSTCRWSPSDVREVTLVGDLPGPLDPYLIELRRPALTS